VALEGFGGRVRAEGRASEGCMSLEQNTKNEFFILFGGQMFIFCRFLMVDLAHFRGPQGSSGALGKRPGSFWKRMFGPWELSGVYLPKCP
jgi:hypothetical protein